MSGLEKITEHIISKANAQADEIIKDAQAKADEIMSKAESDAKAYEENARQKTNAECEKIIQMAESENRQLKRQSILFAKSSAISHIIYDTKKAVKEMKNNEYKNILLTILKNSVSDKEGEILFSENDKKIIDDDFINEIDKISGGKLKISDNFCDIDGGFIIKYGRIEINCSIDSIFEEKYSQLTDLVNSFLSQG